VIPAGRAVWFRRLLVGLVVEMLQERGIVGVWVEVTFSDDSEFGYPRLDNTLRFLGTATLRLPSAAALPGDLQDGLQAAWAALVEQVDVIPFGDRLTVSPSTVEVVAEGTEVVVHFDLRAD